MYGREPYQIQKNPIKDDYVSVTVKFGARLKNRQSNK